MRITYPHLNIHFSIESLDFCIHRLTSGPIREIIPMHKHASESYELHYISSGTGILKLSEETLSFEKNSFFLTGPNITHAQFPSSPEGFEEYCLYLTVRKNQQQLTRLSETFFHTPFWFGTLDCEQLLISLFREFQFRQSGYEAMAEVLCKMLLLRLMREEISSVQTLSPSFGDSLSLMIEEAFLFHYKTVTLTALAKQLNISPRQLERILKRDYGQSFSQKKTEARMQAASVFLTETKKSITEIAELTGYSSSEAFGYSFKQYFRLSPSDYRRKYF